MSHITLNREQARLICESDRTIELRDDTGRQVGFAVPGFTAEDIEEAKRRRASDAPRLSTDEVLDRLSRKSEE